MEKDTSEITVTTKDEKNRDPWVLPGTATFGINTSFPVEYADPQCCTKFGARVFLDHDELQAWVEFRHEETCEVWRFLP